MTMADGRELLYFDDSEPYVSGEQTRTLVDPRELPEAATVSEMRRDPLTGDWTTMAAHRMNRTFMPPANANPLAPSTAGQLPTEIPADDYNVVVFENRFPSFSLHMDPAAVSEHTVDGAAVFPRLPARGRCEVVCFTPDVSASFKDLSVSRIRTVIEAWAHRTAALQAIDGIEQVFPFENRGEEIGVTLQHPHGQIYAYPFVPPRTKAIVAQAKQYRAEHGEDLFAAVLAAECESARRVLHDGEYFVAFVPAAAKWPIEFMIMPKRDVKDFTELTDPEKDELAAMYKDMLQRLDRFFDGVEKTPYIAAWNQAPTGEDRQYVRFHLQVYSLMRQAGRMKFLAGSESAMGAWINDTTPEHIADRFRQLA
ncbi:Galactose-1-phosphate uridylyltransferase [Corynebacterium choanae]|uniref:Galactose-1-phosphate uridylyltransferase n=2 Tax=Corynebacterium choanae TaxID=1862358 RepID=A0A3G6J6V8_9CORY|nr:Galactose-1-phosphate uridylyltransferase [Corynebacterium choanae]